MWVMIFLCVNRSFGCGDAFFGGPLCRTGNPYVWSEGYLQVEDGSPLRPGQMICFIECRYIRVCQITMRNSSSWNLFLHGCDYVQVHELKIVNSKQHANSEGIDIDTCVLSSSACAIRFGVGSGSIRHITVSNLAVARAGKCFTFMTGWQGHGSVDISDILIQNISGDDVGMPLHLLAFEATVKRIIISNFHTNCKGRALIKGKPGWISDLVLRNVDFHDQLFIPPPFFRTGSSNPFQCYFGIPRYRTHRVG